MMITSKANPKIKQVKKLIESGKARRDTGLFVVEGQRLAAEVPDALIKEVYLSEHCLDSRFEKFEVVREDVFRSLSDTVNPQGMLAVVSQPAYKLDDILSGQEESTIVLLDDIRDPGNLGTILRTSEAAGAKGVIMSLNCVDIFNPKVVRSTMGSIFRVPFVKTPLPEAVERLKQEGFSVFGTSLEERRSYRDVDYGKKRAVIIGNEANGIDPALLKLTTANIRIPMKGKVESLNAAVSLAVVLFGIEEQ